MDYVQTRDTFESDITHLTSQFECAEGAKGYWGFMLSFNLSMLLVQARVRCEDGITMLQRFMFADVRKALDFVNDSEGFDNIDSYTIYLLTPFQLNKNAFDVVEVLEIIEAELQDESGNMEPSLVFKCKDDYQYVEIPFGCIVQEGSEHNELRTLYKIS